MIISQQVPVIKTKQPLRALLVSFLVLVSLILVGCGGEEAATTVAIPTPIEESVDTAESLPTAPTPEAPTAVPPTKAPAATDVPEATDAAEVTYTPEPVDQGGGGVLAGGNCANPYFPVVEGATYRYSSTNSLTGPSEYTLIYSNATDDSFDMTFDFGEGEGEEAVGITQTWQCTADGLLAPELLQFNNVDMPFEFETIEAEGLTFTTSTEPGTTWTTHYVVAGSGETEGVTMTMQQTMDLNHEVVGVEAVSVPAGDYPTAVRVESTGTIALVTSVGETGSDPVTIDWSQTTWYVENVGMVRQETIDLFGDAPSVTELVAIE